MLRSIFLRRRCRFRLSRHCRRNNGRDFVFFDELISKIGLDFEHVVFVGDDHAVKLPAVLQANLIRARRSYERAERQNTHRQQKGAALVGVSHKESIPPPTVACNLHSRGSVRRATSASTALKRPASRSTSPVAALSRARSGSGS